MTSGRSIVDFQVGRRLAGSSKHHFEDNKNDFITTHDSKLSPPRDVLKVTPAKELNSKLHSWNFFHRFWEALDEQACQDRKLEVSLMIASGGDGFEKISGGGAKD